MIKFEFVHIEISRARGLFMKLRWEGAFHWPLVLSNYFVINNTIHTYDTRQSAELRSVGCKKSIGQRSIKYLGVKLWNEIDSDLKGHMSIHTFKRILKKHFITRLWYRVNFICFFSFLYILHEFSITCSFLEAYCACHVACPRFSWNRVLFEFWTFECFV